MNYEKSLSQGLVDDILEAVYKYEDAMNTSTAVGCLEIAKMQLIQDMRDRLEEN